MILKGKTQEQVEKEKRIADWQMVIEDSKKDLAETDWVVIKLNESRITKLDEFDALLEKYQPILDAREKMRQDINWAEEELRNAGAV
jgi:hypothetical protein